MSFISSLFGGGQKVSNTAAADVTEAKKTAKKSKAQLISTDAGIVGQELNTNQITSRSTLLGN